MFCQQVQTLIHIHLTSKLLIHFHKHFVRAKPNVYYNPYRSFHEEYMMGHEI